MSNHNEYPHIYHKKKYLGLQIQNISRGDPNYLFTGGKGIEGCTKQLNNINAVVGNIHIMCNFICKTLGINTSFYKENSEEIINEKHLQIALTTEKERTELSQIKEKIESLEQKIINLERKIEILNHISETIIRIDGKV